MDLIKYNGLKVKITLKNNYYYIGKVINSDIDSIELLDIKGNLISLSEEAILTIQEVRE